MKKFSLLLTDLKSAFSESLVGTYAIAIFSDKLSWRHFRDVVFYRKQLNQDYVALYRESDNTKRKPILYLQKEIHMTHAMHKCFVARYKTRLQHYRDAYANKNSRVPSSIDYTNGLLKATIETVKGETR